jgi:ribonuclease P protein component
LRPASVTARYGYPKRSHLRKTDEISSVFDFRRRLAGAYLTVLAKPNMLGYPRLAVMVPRRVSPKAVARNYMRRAVRETFRRQQHQTAALDIVVRVTRGFNREHYAAVSEELIQHLARLSK